MNLDNIYEELKEQVKSKILSEGIFKIMISDDVELESTAVLLDCGSILPKDWVVFEEIFNNWNAKIIFENTEGQFSCFFYEENKLSPILGIVPGVNLPQDFEIRMTEILSDLITEEDFIDAGINLSIKDDWNKYLNMNNKKLKV